MAGSPEKVSLGKNFLLVAYRKYRPNAGVWKATKSGANLFPTKVPKYQYTNYGRNRRDALFHKTLPRA